MQGGRKKAAVVNDGMDTEERPCKGAEGKKGARNRRLPNLGIPDLACGEMARALVLPLLVAGVAALPTHLTSKADDAIFSHLRDRSDASDHATPHSHYPRRIDEELAGQHDTHALTPPDGNGVHHVHCLARGQSRLVGTPDADHDSARRASSRAAHGQTPRHLQLERRRNCGDVTIRGANVQQYQDCTEMRSLNVRARPRPRSADRAEPALLLS